MKRNAVIIFVRSCQPVRGEDGKRGKRLTQNFGCNLHLVNLIFCISGLRGKKKWYLGAVLTGFVIIQLGISISGSGRAPGDNSDYHIYLSPSELDWGQNWISDAKDWTLGDSACSSKEVKNSLDSQLHSSWDQWVSPTGLSRCHNWTITLLTHGILMLAYKWNMDSLAYFKALALFFFATCQSPTRLNVE